METTLLDIVVCGHSATRGIKGVEMIIQREERKEKGHREKWIGTILLVFAFAGILFFRTGMLLLGNVCLRIIEKRFGILLPEYSCHPYQAMFEQVGAIVTVILLLSGVYLLGREEWKRREKRHFVVVASCVLLLGIMLAIPFSEKNWWNMAQNWCEKQVKMVRYGGENSALPKGDFRGIGERKKKKEIALQVVMEKPADLYLRGFVGAKYTGNGWKPMDGECIYASKEVLRKLQKNGFSYASQLGSSAEICQTGEENSIAIKVKEADREYVYTPYGLLKQQLPTRCSYREDGLWSKGIRGQKSYQYKAYSNVVSNYPAISMKIYHAKEAEDYLIAESYYNTYVYEKYLTIPEEIKNYLKKEIGDIRTDKSHISYEEANAVVSDFLDQHLSYSEKVKKYTGASDFVLWVLQAEKKGYDLHYATVATFLYRYLGIPARYVEGYCVTKEDVAYKTSYDMIEIPEERGHAWVEIYQDGAGFVPMEVDPSYQGKMSRPKQGAEGTKNRVKERSDTAKEENSVHKTNSSKAEKQTKDKKADYRWIYESMFFGVLLLLGMLVFLLLKNRDKRKGIHRKIEKQYRKLLKKLKRKGAVTQLPPTMWIKQMEEKIKGCTLQELKMAIQIGEKNRYSKEKCKEEEWKLLKHIYSKIR